MRFKFCCPHCKKTIKAASEHAGRAARCPNCRERIVVPAPDAIGDEDVLDILGVPESAAASYRRPTVATPAGFLQAVAESQNPDALIDALCSFEPDAIERGLASVEGGRYEDFIEAARAVCPWIFLGRILLGYQAYRAKGAEWSRLPEALDHVRCWEILHPRLLPWVRDNAHAGVIQKDAFDLAMDLLSADRDEEALDYLLATRPGVAEDHEFWIFACMYNLVSRGHPRADREGLIAQGEAIEAGHIRVPDACRGQVRQSMERLRSEVGSSAVHTNGQPFVDETLAELNRRGAPSSERIVDVGHLKARDIPDGCENTAIDFADEETSLLSTSEQRESGASETPAHLSTAAYESGNACASDSTDWVDVSPGEFLDERTAWRYGALPLAIHGDLLKIAVPDVGDDHAREVADLSQLLLNRPIRTVALPTKKFEEEFAHRYSLGGKEVSAEGEATESNANESATSGAKRQGLREEIEDMSTSGRITRVERLLLTIVGLAAQDGATEILFRPTETGLQVFMRIPGFVAPLEMIPPPDHLREPILHYLRYKSRRQGVISFVLRDTHLCLHVNSRSTLHGEAVVLSFLQRSDTATEREGDRLGNRTDCDGGGTYVRHVARFCPHCGRQLRDEGDLCVPCATQRLPEKTSIREAWQLATCEQCGRHIRQMGEVVCSHCRFDHALDCAPPAPRIRPEYTLPFAAKRLLEGERQKPTPVQKDVRQDIGLRAPHYPQAADANQTIRLEQSLMHVTPEVLSLVPMNTARTYRVFPVAADEVSITVATTDPDDLELQEQLQFLLNRQVRLQKASAEEIGEAIERSYAEENSRLRSMRMLFVEGQLSQDHQIRVVTEGCDQGGSVGRDPLSVRARRLIVSMVWGAKGSQLRRELHSFRDKLPDEEVMIVTLYARDHFGVPYDSRKALFDDLMTLSGSGQITWLTILDRLLDLLG